MNNKVNKNNLKPLVDANWKILSERDTIFIDDFSHN